jgi:hypothetical protein
MARDVAKLYGFGCLGLIGVLVAGGVMMNRSFARCPPAVETRVFAPDSTREAVVFHFECGFGRKGTINVSIVPAGEDPVYPANLFVAMDSSGVNFLLGRATRPVVDVGWEGPSAVLIRYQAGARVVSRNSSARGVAARYEARE